MTNFFFYSSKFIFLFKMSGDILNTLEICFYHLCQTTNTYTTTIHCVELLIQRITTKNHYSNNNSMLGHVNLYCALYFSLLWAPVVWSAIMSCIFVSFDFDSSLWIISYNVNYIIQCGQLFLKKWMKFDCFFFSFKKLLQF